jgi:tripartite-type tricarboxylate transporter receptor subunit TctC
MSRLKIGVVRFILITSLIAALALPAVAAEFPNKPINLIIPYPPGGSIDLPTRALANATRKQLGQPIICENKAGGGGTVGPSIVISKPPDGYTLGIITSSPTIAYLMGKLNFNPLEDVTHIMRWGGNPFGLAVCSDSQWKTIQDLLHYAKQNPKKVTYGSPGVGTPPHLAMEELGLAAGIEWTHMPYKGVAENNAALLGGHIDVISDSSGWAPLVDAGKFRLLATWGSQRLPRYPQAPSVKETGYNVASSGIVAVMGPATPTLARNLAQVTGEPVCLFDLGGLANVTLQPAAADLRADLLLVGSRLAFFQGSHHFSISRPRGTSRNKDQ